MLRPGESTRVSCSLIHDSETEETISEIERDFTDPNSFLLRASNDSDHVGRSLEISIVVRHRSRPTRIDSYSFQAMIGSPASIVMTYYDSENLLQSKKRSVVYRFDQPETRQTKQLLLTSNDCCRAHVHVVAYDREGHRVTCLPLESVVAS